MKKLIYATLGILISTNVVANVPKSKLLTLITTPEPQTQLMAMVLSMQSLKQGSHINILLCGPAGDLALNEAPETAVSPQKPMNISPQELMKKIINAGAEVDVCALYLPNKGLSVDALIEGVKSAKPSDIAKTMLSTDTRVVSF